jgi:lysophospholipase L1-like esterase
MLPTKRTFVLVFVSAVIGLGLLEVGAALILNLRGSGLSPAPQRHLYATYRGHKLNPAYRHAKDTDNLLLHTPDGFRGIDPVVKTKPGNVFRIIMFGGSAMYGLGAYAERYDYQPALRSNETIDHMLEMQLRERFVEELAGNQIEVLNAGLTGYQTFQHLIHYNERLHQYSPDLILFLDGHNDFYITRSGHNHWLDYDYISTFLAEPFNQRSIYLAVFAGVRVIAPYSHFFTLCEKYFAQRLAKEQRQMKQTRRTNVTMTSEEAVGPSYSTVAHNTYLRVYEQFKALSAFDDFDWLVLLQPEIIFEQDIHLGVADIKTKRITEQSYGHPRVKRMKTVRTLLPELFKRNSIPFVDFGTIGNANLKAKKLYGDHVHLAPAGAKRVASMIVDQIDRQGFIQNWIEQNTWDK